jgi:hypothetical protein
MKQICFYGYGFLGCEAVETEAESSFQTLLPMYETALYHIQKNYTVACSTVAMQRSGEGACVAW